MFVLSDFCEHHFFSLQSRKLRTSMAHIFLVSSASGSGKDTIISHALQRNPSIAKFVTTTTRPKREGEVEGKDYHFVTTREFEDMIARGEMFEHDHHYGYWYGTTTKEVEEAEAYNGAVIWKTDPEGVKFLRQKLRNVTTIAIVPESTAVMEKWLRERKTESEDDIQKRLAVAGQEMKYLKGVADYTVINRDGKINEAVDDFMTIIENEL